MFIIVLWWWPFQFFDPLKKIKTLQGTIQWLFMCIFITDKFVLHVVSDKIDIRGIADHYCLKFLFIIYYFVSLNIQSTRKLKTLHGNMQKQTLGDDNSSSGLVGLVI